MSSISVGNPRTRRATRATGARRAGSSVGRPRDGHEPWAKGDAVVVAVVLVLAVAGLVIGWFGISDTVGLNSQTRWLGFGIGALLLGGFGMVAWLLVGLRSVAMLRREVLTELDRRHPAPARSADAAAGVTERQGYAAANGMRRYHRDGCQLLAGKDVTFTDEAAQRSAGRTPCPICLTAGAHATEEASA
jgi:hypothetical protein